MSKEYGARRRLQPGEDALLDEIRRVGLGKAAAALKAVPGQNDALYDVKTAELERAFIDTDDDWADELPEPFTHDRSPVELDVASAAYFGDVHGIFYDKPAFVAAIKDAQRYDPEAVVFNGDFMDCHAVSHWERDADKRNFVKELDFAEAMIKVIRERFPKSRIVYVEGNHELWYSRRLADRMPEIAKARGVQLEAMLNLANYGVEYVKGARPLKLGKLYTIHGHEIKAGGKYVAANKLAKAGVNILFNHHHRTDTFTATRKFVGETMAGFGVGCLCSLSMGYDPHPEANHGYAYIEVQQDGNFHVNNKRIENGRVL